MTEFKEKAQQLVIKMDGACYPFNMDQKKRADEIELALTEAYEKGISDSIEVVDSEEEPNSCPSDAIKEIISHDPVQSVIASVRATKSNIIKRLLDLKPPRPKDVYLKCQIHKTDLLIDSCEPECEMLFGIDKDVQKRMSEWDSLQGKEK